MRTTNMITLAGALFGAALLASPALAASDITVDTVEDIVDFAQPQTIAQLPGPDGRVSFREACIAANNTPGPQSIGFAIPKDEWWLVDNMAILKIEIYPVLLTDAATTLDFTTQTEFTGDTNPDGPEVGIYGIHPNWYGTPAILISADSCVVRGLGFVWNRVSVSIEGGRFNRVVACVTPSVHIGDSIAPAPSENTIGGTAPGEGNVITGIRLTCYSDNNVIIGNRLRSVGVTGSQYCVYPTGNRIGGPTSAERNVIAGFGTFGEEGFPLGDGIEVYWAKDTLIEGNYIGTSADGLTRVASWVSGVDVADSINTTIRGNLIAGLWVEGYDHYAGQLFGEAIHVGAINADNVGLVIEGNRIGTDATGEKPILTLNGVIAEPLTFNHRPLDVRIGGTDPGQGNLIAFVERRAVTVVAPTDDTEISGNSIHSSGLLGIDLDENGVTLNDPGDPDEGGNMRQNFPVIEGASTSPAGTRVIGAFNSLPNQSFRLEFFASPACDSSGFGEGRVFLGHFAVATDSAGDTAFDETLGTPAPEGWFATATATRIASGATSEFSACAPIAPDGCYADCDGSGGLDIDDFICFQTLFGLGDPGADCDQSGELDIDDFVCFQTAFGIGCD